jgi:hypothetical protein
MDVVAIINILRPESCDKMKILREKQTTSGLTTG